jgi:hypothetical protein
MGWEARSTQTFSIWRVKLPKKVAVRLGSVSIGCLELDCEVGGGDDGIVHQTHILVVSE